MVMKLFLTLRPHYLPLYTLSPKFPILSLSSFTTTATATLNQVPNPNLSYGPSLRKGSVPSIPQSQPALKTLTKPSLQEQPLVNEDYLLDEEKLVRIFDIAALRVPSKDCFAFESRLRGHLLNWPCTRNIASRAVQDNRQTGKPVKPTDRIAPCRHVPVTNDWSVG